MKTALISVFDKMGVADFAKGLESLGYEIMSSGGTAAALRKAGVTVVDVSDYTGFPELLCGRVKTLHPKVLAGILSRRGVPGDEKELAEHKIKKIDLVCVDLYPFEQAVGGGKPLAEVIELIDVGGVSLLRAAAKNFERVLVVSDKSDYGKALDELRKGEGEASRDFRLDMARKAFALTCYYDFLVSEYYSSISGNRTGFPDPLILYFRKAGDLRYGENPHQKAAAYFDSEKNIARVPQLSGKQLSYNNILDADSALALVKDLGEEPAAVIVKHNNPCGGALGATLAEAFRKALSTDPLSAYGGIVAFNKKVDEETARAVADNFVEVIVAPGFEEKAVAVLSEKKNRRLLDATELFGAMQEKDFCSVLGGMLYQDYDSVLLDEANLKRVTKRAPTEEERKALLFAWKFAKHIKSNAVVFATATQVVGIGAGQMSRVDSCKIAVEKAETAGLEVKGTAMASDAFFPFRDTVDFAAQAGATAIIQPGGSIRDAEVIAAADAHGLAMLFTGVRHFKH